jgi:predicted nucleotidyltransferase
VDVVVEIRFGSHLYGTDTPESDLDLKGVYLPEARDILLQRVTPSVAISRAKDDGERNRPGDVDREYYSLHRYLQLLAAGQTVAIDMLFAPDAAMTRSPSPAYHYERLARRAFADVAASDAPPLKRYFYALRPALALTWVRRHQMPPPMDLSSLIAGLDVPDRLARTVEELVVRKAGAREEDTVGRLPVVDAYVEETLAEPVQRPIEKADTSTGVSAANRLLAAVLGIPSAASDH